MTLAKPKEHAVSKRLRKLADRLEADGPDQNLADARNFRHAAVSLDQTIASLGIWKDPARIQTTNAFKHAQHYVVEYERHHPGA